MTARRRNGLTAGLTAGCARVLREYTTLPCPVCGGRPFDGTPNLFCADCLKRLELVPEPRCPTCGGRLSGIFTTCPDCLEAGPRPWVKAWSPFLFSGLVRELVLCCKYRHKTYLARALGLMAARCFLADPTAPTDLAGIVPTPLHVFRQLTRGYNQAHLIATVAGAALGLPVLPVLRKIRPTPRQASLPRAERLKNLSGAFSVNDSTKIEKRAILLVDDVMTTGATLSEASKTLLEAGALRVYVLIIARRQRIG